MEKLILLVCVSIFLTACGGGASNGTNPGNTGTATKPATAASTGAVEIKIKDKTYKLEPKATWLFSEDWTINMPDGKKIPTSTRKLVVANYELEATSGVSSTMKMIDSPDNVRVMISIQDKENITKDTPPTVGDYGPKIEEFQKLLNVQVFTMEGGQRPVINITGSNSDNKGGVKIISVNGDTVTGEIDFSNPDNSIKGPFTAKLWKQAK